MKKARFNVLGNGLSQNEKDIKTPFQQLTKVDRAVNDAAICRFAERRLKAA